MRWLKHDFGDAARNAFRDEVQPLLNFSEKSTIEQHIRDITVIGRHFRTGDSTLNSIVYALLGYEIIWMIETRKPILLLLIKHGLQIPTLLKEMEKVLEPSAELLLLFADCAEVRPEAFAGVQFTIFSEKTLPISGKILAVSDWLRILRLFPSCKFWFDETPRATIMELLERAPSTKNIMCSEAVLDCLSKLNSRRLFALIVGVSDGLLRPSGDGLLRPSDSAPFFNITAALPLELQEHIVHFAQFSDEMHLLIEHHRRLFEYLGEDNKSFPIDYFREVARSKTMLISGAIRLEECDCRWMLEV